MSTPGGEPVGSIVLEEKQSSGASGEVYLGRQPGLGRTVLVRRLRRDLLGSVPLVDRFEREARLAARLQHPNVVQIHDFFSHAGHHYLVLEHVDGSDLRSILERVGRVPSRIAARIAREVLCGLGEIHSRRVIHADVRPEQIQISRWGETKLSGFAFAREIWEEGPSPEPSPYTAPELEGSGPAGPSVDVYSTGVLLRELLTGQARPPGGPRIEDRRLRRLVRLCMQRDPGRRPSVDEALRLLDQQLGQVAPAEARAELAAWLWEVGIFRPRQEVAPPASALAVARKARRSIPISRRHAMAALGAAAAVLAVAVLVSTLPRIERRTERPRAEVASLSDTPPVAAGLPVSASLAPASIAFVVYPWAEVKVDGRDPFLTPRAAPIELPPGEHQVVFRHPRFGEARRNLILEPGQRAVVRHVYTQAEAP
jgi:serine/threonine-protein kinase